MLTDGISILKKFFYLAACIDRIKDSIQWIYP